MRSMYVFILLTIAVLPQELFCHPIRGDTTLRKYCGRALFDAINHVCHGHFGGPSDTNREGHQNFVRREGGAATQCCGRGCSWSMLREYCAPGFSAEEDYSEDLEVPIDEPVNSMKKENIEDQPMEDQPQEKIPERIIWQPARIGLVSDEFTKKAITLP